MLVPSEVLESDTEHGDAKRSDAEDGEACGEGWIRQSLGAYRRRAPSQQAAASCWPLGEKARLVTRSKGTCSCIRYASLTLSACQSMSKSNTSCVCARALTILPMLSSPNFRTVHPSCFRFLPLSGRNLLTFIGTSIKRQPTTRTWQFRFL